MDDDRCLAAGIIIETSNGDKKIEDVVVGDRVLSGIGGGSFGFYKVKKANKKRYHGPILRVTTDYSGVHFRATPTHICFGYPKGEEPSKDKVLLYAFDRGNIVPHAIHDALCSDSIQEFKSLDRMEEAAHEIAQSNGGAEIERFACFTSYEYFKFRPALDLSVGMKIPVLKDDSIQSSTITRIEEEEYSGFVYDLDIPKARNFAANGILVHDSTQ
jgi:hypothetical protein